MMRRVVRLQLCAVQPTQGHQGLKVMPTFHPTPFKYDKFLSIKTRTLGNYSSTEGGVRSRWAALQSKVHDLTTRQGSHTYDDEQQPDAIFALPAALAEELGRINRKTTQLQDMLGFVLPDELVYRSFHNNVTCGAYAEALEQWLQPHILHGQRGPPYPLYIVQDMTFILQRYVLALLPSAAASLSFRSTLPVSYSSSSTAGGQYSPRCDLGTLVQCSAEASSDDACVRAVRAQLSLAFTSGASRTLLNEGRNNEEGQEEEDKYTDREDGEEFDEEGVYVPRLVNRAVYTHDLMSRYYVPLWQASAAMHLLASSPTQAAAGGREDNNNDEEQGEEEKKDDDDDERGEHTDDVQSVAQADLSRVVQAFTANYTPLPHAEYANKEKKRAADAHSTDNQPYMDVEEMLQVPRAIVQHHLALAQCAAEAKETPALLALLRHFSALYLTTSDKKKNDGAESVVTLRVADWCEAVCTSHYDEDMATNTSEVHDVTVRATEELAQPMRVLLEDFATDFLSLVLNAVAEVQMEHQLWQLHDLGRLTTLAREANTSEAAAHRHTIGTSNVDTQRELLCSHLHAQLRQQVMQRMDSTHGTAWQELLHDHVYPYLTQCVQSTTTITTTGAVGNESDAGLAMPLRACIRSYAMAACCGEEHSDELLSQCSLIASKTSPSSLDALEWALCCELIRGNRAYAQLMQRIAQDEESSENTVQQESDDKEDVPQVDWAAWGKSLAAALQHYMRTCTQPASPQADSIGNEDASMSALQAVQQMVELMARILLARHATQQLRALQDCIREPVATMTAEHETSEHAKESEEESSNSKDAAHDAEEGGEGEAGVEQHADEHGEEGQQEQRDDIAAEVVEEEVVEEEGEEGEGEEAAAADAARWMAACERLLTSPSAADMTSDVVRLLQLVQTQYEHATAQHHTSPTATTIKGTQEGKYAAWQNCLAPHTLALLSVLSSGTTAKETQEPSVLCALARIACAHDTVHIAQPLQFGNSLSVLLVMLARASQWPACAALLQKMREASPSASLLGDALLQPASHSSADTAEAAKDKTNDTQASSSKNNNNNSNSSAGQLTSSAGVSCVTLDPGVLLEVFRRARNAGAATVCAELRVMRSQLFF